MVPPEETATPIVFLDRDGVVNRRAPDGDYIRSWAEFEFMPGAIEALAELCRRGALPIIVTNQRGIARGLMSDADVADIHRRMTDVLAENGVHLGGIYVCPHEAGSCDCRKPSVGLFRNAQRDRPSISLAAADLVGDSLVDLMAGQRLDMRVWLVGERSERDQVAADAEHLGIAISGSADSLLDLVRAGHLTAAPAGR
jgi:D-glycero-D-manno-heptose 1,7-bisphosphate phosphatase